ncbi:MAG: histidinol-phosphate transaminase [Leptolyngbyaceae cyanobacterium bins.349]|nr:histidinol-phosphate transaminase [Leptolyngbyaceae cyanobacterium bins.349]
MLPFIRSDLAQLTAYSSHSKERLDDGNRPEPILVDRLDTNESPYDLPDELKQKLAWTLQTVIESNRYPDGGHESLKSAIAEYVNDSAHLTSHAFTADSVSVGNGSDELIRSILIATCLSGAGAILVADPTFSMYGILAQTLGIPVARVGRSPTTFAIDLNAAQTAITTAPTPIRVVFVVHPNSPTGNALTLAEIDWLKSLPSHILVVIDEAYFEFSQTTLVNEVLHRPNWIVLRTFSKAFRLAAHRVGYAIATPELIAVLEKVRLPYNLPSVTQIAAQMVLSHRQQLLETIPLLLQERTQLITDLRQHPWLTVWQSQANFVYVTLNPTQPDQHTLEKIHQTLNQQGTLIRHIAGGFRITVGTPTENTRTVQRLLDIR